MAWERKIPFGYRMEGGIVTAHPKESKAVETIFTLYCGGTSYNGIAEEMMTQGIPYHQKTPRWNKNMVARILENERYIGAGGYPKLIADDKFLSAQLLRQNKTAYTHCPKEIEPIKEKAVCAVCGEKMKRDIKNGYPRWLCQNSECGCRNRISDETLLDTLKELLEKLANTSPLLPAPIQEKSPSIDAIRIQNELNLCLNRAGTSPEYLKSLIFAAAEERYNSTPDPTPAYENEQLREQLGQYPYAKDTLTELFQQYVSAVLIGTESSIALRLPDGTVFRSEEGE